MGKAVALQIKTLTIASLIIIGINVVEIQRHVHLQMQCV